MADSQRRSTMAAAIVFVYACEEQTAGRRAPAGAAGEQYEELQTRRGMENAGRDIAGEN